MACYGDRKQDGSGLISQQPQPGASLLMEPLSKGFKPREQPMRAAKDKTVVEVLRGLEEDVMFELSRPAKDTRLT